MKKIIVLLMILATGSVFTSCESTTYCDISYVANPTFTANIGPIVKASCAGCHSGGKQSNNYVTYTDVKNGMINGDVLCRIDQSQACGRVMPQSGSMPVCTIDMFKRWADQGYIN